MRIERLQVALFLALFAGGVLLRFSAGGKIDSQSRLQEYSRTDYYEFGRGLQEFGVLGWNGVPDAFRGIAYPAFLSGIEAYDPAIKPRVPKAHALLASAVIPIAAWAALEVGGPPAALAAAAFVSFHPTLRESLDGCRIEVFYSLLVLIVALALIAWTRAPTMTRTWLLGFAIAVSLLCRGVLFFLPPLLVAVYWRRPGFAPTRRRWAAILLAGSYLFLLPWVARNAVQFGTFTPFEDHAATRNLFAASMGIVENSGFGPYQDVLANQVDPNGALREDPLPRIQELAVKRIREAPGAYLSSCLRRSAFAFKNYWGVFLLALAGFLLRRKDPAIIGLGVLSAYFVLIHLPMSLELRYFEPAVPGLLVLAGVAAAGLWSRARRAPPRAPADRMRWVPALVLVLLVPLYLLCTLRLATEVALTKFPCALPETGLSLYRCGQSQEAAGAPDAAARAWTKSLALLDQDASASPRLKAKVVIELAGGPAREAAASRLPEVAASLPAEVWEKAIWLQDHRRLPDAIFLLDLLVEAHPSEPRYLTDRGLARVLADEPAQGLKDFIRAEAVAPGDLHACLNHGALLERDGRMSEALRVYSRALAAARRPLRPGEMPSLYLPVITSRWKDLSERLSRRGAPPKG